MQINDPALRARLTPDYPIGCKRILICADFYPALARANVTLETAPIQCIEPDGIRAANADHPLDIIVFATGFDTTRWNWSVDIRGNGGVALADARADGPEAYLGTMAASQYAPAVRPPTPISGIIRSAT